MAVSRRRVDASLSQNTRRVYAGALRQLDAWLAVRTLDDATLALYLAGFHDAGRAPTSAALAVRRRRFPSLRSRFGNRLRTHAARAQVGRRFGR